MRKKHKWKTQMKYIYQNMRERKNEEWNMWLEYERKKERKKSEMYD